MPKINDLEWDTALTFANVDVEQVLKADSNNIYKLTQEVEKLAKEASVDLAKFKIKEIWSLKDRAAMLNMMKVFLGTVKQSIPSMKMLADKEPPNHVIVAMHSIVLASKSLPCEKLHPVVKLIGNVYGKKFVDQALRVKPTVGKGGKTDPKEQLTMADERLQLLLSGGDMTTEKIDTEYSRIRSRVMGVPKMHVPGPVPVVSVSAGGANSAASLIPNIGGPGNGPGTIGGDDFGGISSGSGGGGGNYPSDPYGGAGPQDGGNDGSHEQPDGNMLSLFPIAGADSNDPYPTGDICQPSNRGNPPPDVPAVGTDNGALTMDASIQDMLKKLSNY